MTTTSVSSLESVTPAVVSPDAPLASATDCELIGRFAKSRDEAAFAQLVARHGPLVLSVSRRILRHAEDQEDVFQAAFLALARESGRVRWQTSLAGWLYKVAYRSALRLRAQRAARRETPVEDAAMIPDEQLDDLAELDQQQRLFDELDELPAVYRDAILVSCLEGLDREQAAAQLGCSELVLKGRLQRGRRMLLRRLGVQGLAVAGVLTAAQQSVQAASTAISPELVADTTQAAVAWASGKVALSAVLSNTSAYPQGAWITMLHTTAFKSLMICVCSMAALWSGMALVSGGPPGRSLGQAPLRNAVGEEDPSLESPIVAVEVAADEEKPAEKGPSEKALAEKKASKAAPKKPFRNAEQAKAAILKALDEPTSVEFQGVALIEGIEFLKDLHSIPIQLDVISLQRNAIDPSTAIDLKQDNISLKAALRLITEPLGLKPVIRNEVLLVTTIDEARLEVNTQVYRVDELLGEGKDGPLATDGTLIEDLAQTIMATIAPDTWEGPGSIKPLGRSVLVIRQTDEAHDEIKKLLTSLKFDQ